MVDNLLKLVLPFFHYTILDNLNNILHSKAIRAREYLSSEEYRDVSIDPGQPWRTKYGLRGYIPFYVGFHSFYRSYTLNGYLQRNYDSPKFSNIRFYGSLSKNLRTEILKDDYAKVIILMIKEETVLNYADGGKIRLFTDIAIKSDSEEIEVTNRKEFVESVIKNINERNQTCCEVDMLDDGKELVRFPEDIEAIIVDSKEIRTVVEANISQILGTNILSKFLIFESPLPRKDKEETNLA